MSGKNGYEKYFVLPTTFTCGSTYRSKLQSLGADVEYKEYPGVKHNSWDNAYAEKSLLPWMFAQKRWVKYDVDDLNFWDGFIID